MNHDTRVVTKVIFDAAEQKLIIEIDGAPALVMEDIGPPVVELSLPERTIDRRQVEGDEFVGRMVENHYDEGRIDLSFKFRKWVSSFRIEQTRSIFRMHPDPKAVYGPDRKGYGDPE